MSRSLTSLSSSSPWVLLLPCALAACPTTPPPAPPGPALVDLVDPTIGTGGFAFAYGGSFLGATVPHGLVKVGPDTTGSFGETGFVHTSGSWADDPTILAFSHLHLSGTGLPEGGALAVMPTTSFRDEAPRARDYPATRIEEVARADRYAVRLLEPDIEVRLTATPHASLEAFTFPAGGAHNVVVVDTSHTIADVQLLAGALEVDEAARTVRGAVSLYGGISPPGGYQVFFALRADAPFVARTFDVDKAGVVAKSAALDFGDAQDVQLAVALSYVDLEGAAANLAAELGDDDDAGLDFDGTAKAARAAWHELLGAVDVRGGSDKDRIALASALYRCFLMPTAMSDVDGRFRGADGAVHVTEGFRMMTDLSLWDTYRTVQPLYALLAPESARDVALSVATFTDQLGFPPLWPMATGDSSTMIGSPGEVVLADALQKGVIDVDDVAFAWPTLRAAALSAEDPPAGRGGRNDVTAYDALGYVPSPLRGPVSKTLEYSIADTSLAALADALGEADDAAHLRTRAARWTTLFDDATGFLRGKDADGNWRIADDAFFPEDFNDDYVEADAWQSSFPLDDIDGLVAAFGSRDAAAAQIQRMYQATVDDWATRDPASELFGVQPLPFHWQGNEPSIHIPALAYELGDDELGAEFVGFVMQTQYGTGVEGLPGNDDGGALSAWWVLASFGLHPIPGSADWVVGRPLFSSVRLPGGTRIERRGDGPLVFERRLDDARLDGARVAHAALLGATLEVGVTDLE